LIYLKENKTLEFPELEKLKNQHEKDLMPIIEKHTALFKARARQLFLELRPIFPVTRLIMGNGDWCIYGGEFSVTWDDYEDGEGSTINVKDMFDVIHEYTRAWSTIGLTENAIEKLKELEELLMFVTDVRNPLNVFDIDLEGE